MIVFYGRQDDPPLALAVEAAAELGVDYVVVDQARLDRHHLMVEVGPAGVRGELWVDRRRIALEAATGVYARPLEPASYWRDEITRLRAETLQRAFVEWLDYAPGLVINRPAAMESNCSKPYQAQLIARAGFAVPDTLVSSDPDEIAAFRAGHGRVIYKSVSGIRSIVRELDDTAAARLPAVRDLPAQFQSYVSGQDVRVHVVGTETFATAVRSDAVDYRYAAQDGLAAELTSVDLPPEVRERCLELSALLQLPFCGIDLRRDGDGGWVCFEVNPMPAYSYYQAHTGVPISTALARLVAGHRPAARS
ncbi:MAG TPA: hypothetical protein VGP36_24450 [Mycobacteriales bacterium]|nr:hypothetical protein [Mycobacteriales bacterium]